MSCTLLYDCAYRCVADAAHRCTCATKCALTSAHTHTYIDTHTHCERGCAHDTCVLTRATQVTTQSKCAHLPGHTSESCGLPRTPSGTSIALADAPPSRRCASRRHVHNPPWSRSGCALQGCNHTLLSFPGRSPVPQATIACRDERAPAVWPQRSASWRPTEAGRLPPSTGGVAEDRTSTPQRCGELRVSRSPALPRHTQSPMDRQ